MREQQNDNQNNYSRSINSDQVENPTKKNNETGIPDNMKASIEYISGFSLDKVRVHYNSDKPAEKEAHAYTEGFNIYIAPGQEQHLAHELWHVVQQLKGEAKTTIVLEDGTKVDDNPSSEQEADEKAQEAQAIPTKIAPETLKEGSVSENVIQRKGILYDKSGDMYTVNNFNELLDVIGKIHKVGKAAKSKKVVSALNDILKEDILFNPLLFNLFCANKDGYWDWSVNVLEDVADFYQKNIDAIETEAAIIEQSKDYKGLINIYSKTEGDDGESVKDDYDSSLACTLFALLAVKGSHLGASTPEQLHNVLRTIPKFKEYDEDKTVGLIRKQAGLKYDASQKDVKVSNYISSLKQSDRKRKFIVDIVGEAHTFALKYEGSAWKRFDNGSSTGYQSGLDIGSWANKKISVLWE